jgi:hypothetical protein
VPDSFFLYTPVDADRALRDVENLTGLPPEGFDLPLEAQNLEGKR